MEIKESISGSQWNRKSGIPYSCEALISLAINSIQYIINIIVLLYPYTGLPVAHHIHRSSLGKTASATYAKHSHIHRFFDTISQEATRLTNLSLSAADRSPP